MSLNRLSDTSKLHRRTIWRIGSGLLRVSDVWFTMTFSNDIQIYEKVIELHQQLVTDWKAESSDGDFITQLMFQSIPTIFAKHSKERGGNVLGLDELDENVVMLLFSFSVKGADLEVLARAKLRSFGEQVQAYAASLNGLIDWQYLNYADYYQVCHDICCKRNLG
jgi:hypothetical protein